MQQALICINLIFQPSNSVLPGRVSRNIRVYIIEGNSVKGGIAIISGIVRTGNAGIKPYPMSMKQKDLTIYLSLPLIALFAYTAVSKLQDLALFRKAMLNQPLPEALSSQLVWAVPLLELLAVALLLYRPLRLWGFALGSLLMGLFSGYVALILLGQFGTFPVPAAASWKVFPGNSTYS